MANKLKTKEVAINYRNLTKEKRDDVKKFIEDDFKRQLLEELELYLRNNGARYPLYHSRQSKQLSPSKTYLTYFKKSMYECIKETNIKLSENDDIYLDLKYGDLKLTKDMIVNKIFEMQDCKNDNLIYDDFRGSYPDTVPIDIINSTWGSLNDMKLDLCLPITQEDMTSKSQTLAELKCQIINMCNIIHKEEKRKTIMARDINNYCKVNYYTVYRTFKNSNEISLRDFISNLGFFMQKAGMGMNFTYEDGEKVFSSYEFLFSNYLRDMGLEYGVDYFRGIKYKTINNVCENNKDCDYLIKYNNRNIYIEIAGVLENYKYKYIRNEIIPSESKENYRLSLVWKDNFLKSNSCDYFILFPCDITKDNLYKILNEDYVSIKKSIDNFVFHNIDWNRVSLIGELKYDERESKISKSIIIVQKE